MTHTVHPAANGLCTSRDDAQGHLDDTKDSSAMSQRLAKEFRKVILSISLSAADPEWISAISVRGLLGFDEAEFDNLITNFPSPKNMLTAVFEQAYQQCDVSDNDIKAN
jgi:hypothetical protein